MADSEKDDIVKQAEETALVEALGMVAAGLISEEELPVMVLSIKDEIFRKLWKNPKC